MDKTKGILLTILSAVTFGFAFTLGPMTYGAGGSNPVTLTFLRNFLSLPFLLAILLMKRERLGVTKKELKDLTILSAIGTAVTTLMLNMSYAYIDVGVATTIHFVYPVFVTLGCFFFFKEKLNPTKITALVVATLGIACFFLTSQGSGAQNPQAPLGLTLAVASGVTYAFYIVFIDKSGLKSHNPFKITLYVALIASVCVGVYGLLTQTLTLATLTPKSWLLSVIFAVLCNAVALTLLQVGINHIGASTAAVISTFEPITSVIFGVLLLGEVLSPMKIFSCILIIIGVMILSLAKEKADPKPLTSTALKTFS